VADRLIILFFWGRRRCAVRPNNRAVDHRVFVVGVGGQMLKDALPHPGLGPAAEPSVRVLPIAKALGQIAPGNSGAVAIQNRFDEAPIILSGGANMPDSSRQQVLYPLPLLVAQVIGQPF
jgi:hypothetical protein